MANVKDWKGDTNSVFKTLGSSSHCKEERQSDDFYATDPIAVDLLLKEEQFEGGIWEPCCGRGHLSERFKQLGQSVFSTDLIDRGYAKSGVDFLKEQNSPAFNIVTNPPYSLAQEFVEHAISLVPVGGKVAMFLKLTFLEGKKRKSLFKRFPVKTVYVSSSRILCAKNGDFDTQRKIGSAIAYAWFVWEKGYTGNSVIKWIN